MGEQRLNRFIEIETLTASGMLREYDPSLKLESIMPIHSGMSTSNYVLSAKGRKYLLKVYLDSQSDTGKVEQSMYDYLAGKISVPSVLYYNQANPRSPYHFAIIEYIEGTTLNEYILEQNRYPVELMSQIAGSLAVIHNKKYACRGLLAPDFQIKRTFRPVKEQIVYLLSDNAGKHLPSSVRNKLLHFAETREDIFASIESLFVLSHGDFSYNNMIVSPEGKVFLIDFEYAMATNRYHDIGHFFRRKSDEVEQLIGQGVYKRFADAYNEASEISLPENWFQLAKVVDIPAMLGLINREQVPQEWIDDISYDIDTFFEKIM